MRLPQMLTLIQFKFAVQIFLPKWKWHRFAGAYIVSIVHIPIHITYVSYLHFLSPNQIPSFESDFGMALKGRLECFTAML